MVRNEADIIETFVRYHCEIVDAMRIVDHASIDGTSDILEGLRREGLPLHLTTKRGVAHDQSIVVTRAAKNAASVHGADLVVPLDADEFLISPGTSAVRSAVEGLAVTRDRYFRAPWLTYVPTAADTAEERNVLKRIQRRRKLEPRQYWKAIIPGRLMRRRSAVVSFGSHELKKYGWIWHRRHPCVAAPGLGIAHFPVRSSEQLVRKVLLGWPSHLARADKKGGENNHWEALYQRFRRGAMPTSDELSALALTYAAAEDSPESGTTELVHDPVLPVDRWFDLRYERAEVVPLVTHLAAAMEQLAESLAERTAGLRVWSTGESDRD
jgi:hypothetical protein